MTWALLTTALAVCIVVVYGVLIGQLIIRLEREQ